MKIIALFIINIILLGKVDAQEAVYMPVGFKNPFLKSGQYISTLSYSEDRIKGEIDSRAGYKVKEKTVRFTNYLGLTDRITLSAQSVFYPTQTVLRNFGDYSGNDKIEYYLKPNFILSYRFSKSFELFGIYSFSLSKKKLGTKNTSIISGLI